MPYIQVRVSCKVTEPQADQLKAMLGEKLPLMKGKHEGVLMVEIADGCKLYYKGSNEKPIAYVNVCINNKPVPEEEQLAFAKEVFLGIHEILGIELSQMNLTFQVQSLWCSDRNLGFDDVK